VPWQSALTRFFCHLPLAAAYSYLPDPRVPLTARGWQQAMQAGDRLRAELDTVNCGKPYNLFFYTSPYLRSRQVWCCWPGTMGLVDLWLSNRCSAHL
jgi:phosphohistidine phosphatase SixA